MAGDEASEMGRYRSQTCLKYEAKESELYQRSYGVPLIKFKQGSDISRCLGPGNKTGARGSCEGRDVKRHFPGGTNLAFSSPTYLLSCD